MLRLNFSSIASYIISRGKTASKNIRTLIPFANCLFPDVALYFYKSIIRPCMECCHFWIGARSCYLELLDKLQKEYAGLLVLHSLLLLNPWHIVKMWPAWVFPLGITLVDVLQNWLNRFNFLFLVGGLLVILIDCMIFLSPFLDVNRMSMSTVSFLAHLEILCL